MRDAWNAGALCVRDVATITRHTPIDEAARVMRERHVGALVVIDSTPEGRFAVGMLTDRDIVTSIVAKDVGAEMVRAEEAMSHELVTVREEDSITDVLDTMKRKGIRRVPVVDARGTLQGIVALDDLLEMLAGQLGDVVAAITAARQREKLIRA